MSDHHRLVHSVTSPRNRIGELSSPADPLLIASLYLTLTDYMKKNTDSLMALHSTSMVLSFWVPPPLVAPLLPSADSTMIPVYLHFVSFSQIHQSYIEKYLLDLCVLMSLRFLF